MTFPLRTGRADVLQLKAYLWISCWSLLSKTDLERPAPTLKFLCFAFGRERRSSAVWFMRVQVLSGGHLLGPAGVEVTLSRAGTEEKLQTVVTQPGGKYVPHPFVSAAFIPSTAAAAAAAATSSLCVLHHTGTPSSKFCPDITTSQRPTRPGP